MDLRLYDCTCPACSETFETQISGGEVECPNCGHVGSDESFDAGEVPMGGYDPDENGLFCPSCGANNDKPDINSDLSDVVCGCCGHTASETDYFTSYADFIADRQP